jgi:6,7-dimethyl-8-ribityllumazine synthase
MEGRKVEMPSIIVGKLDSGGLSIAIIVSRFNSLIGERLVEGAVDIICRTGGDCEAISICKVPGAFEIPLVAKRLAVTGRFDAVVCLGAIIRGETPHFDYVSAEVTKGVAQVMLDTGVPISFGVLTTDSLEQAIERAGSKAGNKGADAALAAIEMANLLKSMV